MGLACERINFFNPLVVSTNNVFIHVRYIVTINFRNSQNILLNTLDTCHASWRCNFFISFNNWLRYLFLGFLFFKLIGFLITTRLEKGVIVYVCDSRGVRDIYEADGSNVLAGSEPLAVLVWSHSDVFCFATLHALCSSLEAVRLV